MSDIETISVALFESQCARYVKLLRVAMIGWAVSVVLLLGVICTLATAETTAEEYTETMTVAQDSGDGGSNTYTGGDSIGEANYNGDQDLQEDDAQS